MKRSLPLAALALSSIVVAGLAGCSGTKSESKDPLTIWTFKQSEVTALETVGKEWTKKSGVPLKVSVYTPDDTYKTKVMSAAKSKTLPDIVSAHSASLDWVLAQAGIVEDLTDDFDQQWRDSFLPGIVSGMELTQEKIDGAGDDPNTTIKDLKVGHFYSIPILGGTAGVVFARTSMLEKAGVDTKEMPTTWEDWVAAMKKTVDADADTGGLVTGMQVPSTGYRWIYRPMANAYLGRDAFRGRESKAATPAWNSPESLRTIELFDELTPLWTPGVLALDIDGADQAFASGKAAWDVGGTFTLSSLKAFGLSIDDVQVFPVPASTAGKDSKVVYQASPLIGASITTTSKKKDKALDFIKYLTSVEGAQIFAREAADLPATALPVEQLEDPLLQQLVGLISDEKDGPAPFDPNDFSATPAGTVFIDAADTLSALVSRTATPRQVADKLTEQYRAAWDALR